MVNKHRYLIIFSFFLFLSSCQALNPCKDEELLRLISPDSKVEALLIRRDCGATTDYAYYVFIVPTGNNYSRSEHIFLADHIDDEAIQWNSPKLLEIKYKKARIFHFTNFWQSKDVENFDYVVEIRETPLTVPPSLSPRLSPQNR